MSDGIDAGERSSASARPFSGGSGAAARLTPAAVSATRYASSPGSPRRRPGPALPAGAATFAEEGSRTPDTTAAEAE